MKTGTKGSRIQHSCYGSWRLFAAPVGVEKGDLRCQGQQGVALMKHTWLIADYADCQLQMGVSKAVLTTLLTTLLTAI